MMSNVNFMSFDVSLWRSCSQWNFRLENLSIEVITRIFNNFSKTEKAENIFELSLIIVFLFFDPNQKIIELDRISSKMRGTCSIL